MSAAEHALASSAGIPLSEQGPAPTRVVAGFGFWLFLLSDILIFAALFAAYSVLAGETAGGPSGADLFDRKHVFIETLCLLASSVTCGFGTLAVQRAQAASVYFWMALTFLLGGAFLGLELGEFRDMLARGAGPSHSAFLSAFFALVGTHGLHVTLGLCWMIVMLLQVATLGFRPMVARRFFCFGLFWHALDIVWVGVFTIVYLGAR
ncbi:MAG: cytochrome o ubiquinol oxidase subunit [Gammaproteobacteria bacterium]|jgi:cytochrome o ubiquinol oxidase subunit 3|nr:cytochrome o ubiquinol oxidase subunit [Gammaproteobacteria bacterium]